MGSSVSCPKCGKIAFRSKRRWHNSCAQWCDECWDAWLGDEGGVCPVCNGPNEVTCGGCSGPLRAFSRESTLGLYCRACFEDVSVNRRRGEAGGI